MNVERICPKCGGKFKVLVPLKQHLMYAHDVEEGEADTYVLWLTAFGQGENDA